MGTEHLKARCICPAWSNVANPGCPIHDKPTPVGYECPEKCGQPSWHHDPAYCVPDDFDVINKPKHYNSHPSGVECIDIARHLTGDWFNAFKYVFRADHKNGRQDIEKSIYYAEDGLAHPIPVKLSSWSEREDELIKRVYDAEPNPSGRRDFFHAIANSWPQTALVCLRHILVEYPEA